MSAAEAGERAEAGAASGGSGSCDPGIEARMRANMQRQREALRRQQEMLAQLRLEATERDESGAEREVSLTSSTWTTGRAFAAPSPISAVNGPSAASGRAMAGGGAKGSAGGGSSGGTATAQAVGTSALDPGPETKLRSELSHVEFLRRQIARRESAVAAQNEENARLALEAEQVGSLRAQTAALQERLHARETEAREAEERARGSEERAQEAEERAREVCPHPLPATHSSFRAHPRSPSLPSGRPPQRGSGRWGRRRRVQRLRAGASVR